MELIVVFVGMVVCFIVIGIAFGISEDRRTKQGKPSRYADSRIMLAQRIGRPWRHR